jgi:hypothetical protein
MLLGAGKNCRHVLSACRTLRPTLWEGYSIQICAATALAWLHYKSDDADLRTSLLRSRRAPRQVGPRRETETKRGFA